MGERSPDHGIRRASERRTTDMKIDSYMFVDISLVVVEKPRDLLCVIIHQLKIMLFAKSDDRSQNAGKTKGRTFLTDLIVNLVNFFPEFGKAFSWIN